MFGRKNRVHSVGLMLVGWFPPLSGLCLVCSVVRDVGVVVVVVGVVNLCLVLHNGPAASHGGARDSVSAGQSSRWVQQHQWYVGGSVYSVWMVGWISLSALANKALCRLNRNVRRCRWHGPRAVVLVWIRR